MASEKLVKIGEVAKRTGTSLRTIRYYEELDLIRPKVRTQGGFRLYTEEECKRVQLIKNLQLLDFPLAKIKGLFDGRGNAVTGGEAADEMRRILDEHLRETEARIARYLEMKRAIEETLAIFHECQGCLQPPTRDACLSCDNITTRDVLPLPLECLITAS